MNKSQVIRLSGWALMLGGLAIAVGFLFGAGAVFIGTFLLAPIFLGAGMLGLRARYGREMGPAGRYILLAGVLGSAIALVGAVGQILGDESFFLGTFVGLTLIFASFLVFGVLALRRKLLPRWNGLPVFAGIWVPLIALITAISEVFAVDLMPLPGNDLVFSGVFVLVGVALLLVGYVLQADASATGEAAFAQ